MEIQDRCKTRHTSVETEPRPRHEKLCLAKVLRQGTCLEISSLVIAALHLFSVRILWRACYHQLQTIHMLGSETMCIPYWECGVLHLPTERQPTLMKTELKPTNWSRWVVMLVF